MPACVAGSGKGKAPLLACSSGGPSDSRGSPRLEDARLLSSAPPPARPRPSPCGPEVPEPHGSSVWDAELRVRRPSCAPSAPGLTSVPSHSASPPARPTPYFGSGCRCCCCCCCCWWWWWWCCLGSVCASSLRCSLAAASDPAGQQAHRRTPLQGPSHMVRSHVLLAGPERGTYASEWRGRHAVGSCARVCKRWRRPTADNPAPTLAGRVLCHDRALLAS